MTEKLYPPTIAGTLPSFYEIDYGTTTLVVPFSMNKTVSVAAVKKFSLRIKTTNTDILYGVLESDKWNRNEITNSVVYFDVPQEVLNRLSIGSFYKVQLAYIDTDDIVGYYSTVGIIKFTAKPDVVISDFNIAGTNLNRTEYIGIYRNAKDPGEKAYQYRFCLYDKNNELLETSGWKIHNSYEDASLTESIDKYVLRYALMQNETYKLQYQIITNNNLEVNSPKYLVMDAESINPEIKAVLTAKLDYNNACIDLNLIGDSAEDGSEYAATGAFLLSRASSLDNFSSWLPISNFRMTGELPSAFLFRDYTIAQGVTYIYSLQQFNDYGIYSNRLLTDYVEAQFEDIYLFDGEKQLRVRFNPKISSFKTVVQESKKVTIGAKHPYIFRSGATEYKEFPISGLVSYMMDNDEFFLSISKDLFINNWENTTDITDENVMVERLFKLQVLDWLNDGKPKLFKSPQEGNYIVRLMNVSMSPIDTVSRMLHNFNCQATEIADFTSDNLILYGLMDTADLITYQMRWETVILQDRQRELLSEGKTIYGQDLLRGYEAYYIKFTDTIVGTTFEFTDANGTTHSIMIGATGSYEIQLDKPITNLRMVTNNNSSDIGQRLLQGSLTFSMLSSTQNKFDTITSVSNKDIPLHQVFGPTDNLLEYYNNVKRQVTRIYFAKFSKLDIQEVNSPLFAKRLSNGTIATTLNGTIVTLDKNALYDIQTIDKDGQIVHTYYRYFSNIEYIESLKSQYLLDFNEEYNADKVWTAIDMANTTKYNAWFKIKEKERVLDLTDKTGKLYTYPHFFTSPYKNPIVLDPHVLYKDDTTNIYYWLAKDELTPASGITINNNQYSMNYNDLNQYTIYLKRYYDKGKLIEEYYKYDGVSLIQIDDYSTKIKYTKIIPTDFDNTYKDVEFDVQDSGSVYIEELAALPESISIGAGVCAELGMQVKFITYNVEKYCETEKLAYEEALMNYNLAVLGLKTVEDKSEMLKSETIDTDVYYIWTDDTFYPIRGRLEIEEYATRTALVYKISDTYASAETIQDLYNNYLVPAEKIFLDKVEEYLILYEEDEIV